MANTLAQISTHRLRIIEALTLGKVSLNIPRHKLVYRFHLGGFGLADSAKLGQRANRRAEQRANTAKRFQQPTGHTHRVFALAAGNQTQRQKFCRRQSFRPVTQKPLSWPLIFLPSSDYVFTGFNVNLRFF
jgi:hypothetical protein